MTVDPGSKDPRDSQLKNFCEDKLWSRKTPRLTPPLGKGGYGELNIYCFI